MRGHVIIASAKYARQLALGHVERTKRQIKERKVRREILVAALIRIGVVPTMKDWAGDNIVDCTGA